MLRSDAQVFGWDVGGAHVKVCRLHDGAVAEVVQWACPLWQGLSHLQAVLDAACERWPQARGARHAVTMTGEMADLFSHREEGVHRIAQVLADHFPDAADLRLFAGDDGWCTPSSIGRQWPQIASANWLATARHAAVRLQERGASQGLLIDIGSTTTDLIAFADGRVLTRARSDAERLATGELVYHGVVRTPLCALAHRIDWQGRDCNVMNEFFATVADVYRLTGELDPGHDLYPSADNAAKDSAATRQRLARMVGLDARDAQPEDWSAFAQAWRRCQVEELAGQVRRVMALHGLSADTATVSAGCGDFLVPDIRRVAGLTASSVTIRYGDGIASVAGDAQVKRWAQVCAPSVAVAALFEREIG